MNLNQHFQQNRKPTVIKGYVFYRPMPRIVCIDGFDLSVQVGSAMYCTPRTDTGPWSHVEVGYPSAPEPALMEYAEEPDRPTSTVYGWVPVELVESIIERHGGAR